MFTLTFMLRHLKKQIVSINEVCNRKAADIQFLESHQENPRAFWVRICFTKNHFFVITQIIA